MSDTMNETDDDDIVVVEVDELPDEKALQAREAAEADDDADEPEEDSRLADDEDEEDEGADDTEPKRRKRLKRRQVQKMAKEAAQAELRMLRETNQDLIRRLSAVEGNALHNNEVAIDQRINEARRDVHQAEQIIARAVEAGNGDDVAAAIRLRDEAISSTRELEGIKYQISQTRSAPPAADPRTASLAQQWVQANPWYDPKGSTEDSAITNAIDARLVAEGFNPSSVDYWQELTRRVGARLNPAAAAASAEDRTVTPKKKAPPLGSNREHVPTSTKREVYVTPERKQAMVDAGIWEDPTKRNQMLKAYQKYDKDAVR